MTVLHTRHRQVCTLGRDDASFFLASSSAIFHVISAGRWDVQASQARKSTGLCKVQIGHVHPVRGFGAAGAGVGLCDGAGAVAVEVFEVTAFGFCFFERDSVTKRLMCRGSCLGAPGNEVGPELEEEERPDAAGLWRPISPPPLPVGFEGVAGIN